MAEVFGVVAGVVGVISLSIQLIDKLKQLEANDGSKEIKQFVDDLKSSRAILETAQNMAMLAQSQNLTSQTQLALSSLTLHIDDYSKELSGWVSQANATGLLEQRKTANKGLFSKIGAARRFIGSKSRLDSRMAIRDRVKFFENKLTLLIGVFGRELDFNHANDLEKLSAHFVLFSKGVSDKASSISDKLKHILQSNVSMLSSSRSTEQRMGDFQSEMSSLRADLQDFKTAMMEIASSASSQSNVASQLQDANAESTQSQPQGDPHVDLYRGDSPVQDEDDSSDWESESNWTNKLLFDTFIRTARIIEHETLKMFSVPVSEYFATLTSWYLLGRLSVALNKGEEPQSGNGELSLDSLEVPLEDRKEILAGELLVQRNKCRLEAHEQELRRVEAAFGVTKDTINEWQSLVPGIQDSINPMPALEAAVDLHHDATSQTSIKVSTWLFTMVDDYPDHIDLHRMIFDETWGSAIDWQNSASQDFPRPENTSHEGWKQLMLKYWFIDGAGNRTVDTAESLNPESIESDTTVLFSEEPSQEFIGYDYENVPNDEMLRDSGTMFSILREPPVPSSWAASARLSLGLTEGVNDRASESQLGKAATDLGLYRVEEKPGIDQQILQNKYAAVFSRRINPDVRRLELRKG